MSLRIAHPRPLLPLLLRSRQQTLCNGAQWRFRTVATAAAVMKRSRRDAASPTTLDRNVLSSTPNSNRNFAHSHQGIMAPTLASHATDLDRNSNLEQKQQQPPGSSSSSIPIPESFWSDLERAALWQPNQANWKPEFCRALVAQYDTYINQLVTEQNNNKDSSNNTMTSSSFISESCRDRLLAAETVTTAFKALIKCHFHAPADLSTAVRHWERTIGQLGRTSLTDHLSLRLLTANAKAGNLGRCLSLLELRARNNYRPRVREFLYTITALHVAAGTPGSKNLFVPDREQPLLDNPTRWLDAILIHMKQRQFPLDTAVANRMLQCYAGTGYTGKASHHFYRVARHPVKSAEEHHQHNNNTAHTTTTAAAIDSNNNDEPEHPPPSHRPRDWFYVPELGRHAFQETQVKLIYSRHPPPFYKIPAQVKGKLLFRADEKNHSRAGGGQLRLERETEPEYSIPLAAAFAFADSLQQGACGHDPVLFNVGSYNALIKVCVYRGALWRAMHVLDTVLPNAPSSGGDGSPPLRPNHVSYNLVLAGLARVGDVVTAQKYYHQMLNDAHLEPDAYTVRAIVDGLLNLVDVPAAVTVVQDFFNQHSVLPPTATHCKILETCLGRGMIFEAKRYVYFIQQLWHWKPMPQYEHYTPAFLQVMRSTQRNPQLQKPALQKMFAYFGESLEETDFL